LVVEIEEFQQPNPVHIVIRFHVQTQKV